MDVVNEDLDFRNADPLLEQALPMARGLGGLKRRASRKKILGVYTNDNFGLVGNPDFKHSVRPCERSPCCQVSQLLHIRGKDCFVVKPIHSDLYSTTPRPLARVLPNSRIHHHGDRREYLCSFHFNDAYIRANLVPFDYVASNRSTDRIFAASNAYDPEG